MTRFGSIRVRVAVVNNIMNRHAANAVDSDEVGSLVHDHGLIEDPQRYAAALVLAVRGRPVVFGGTDYYTDSTMISTPPLVALLEPLRRHPCNVDVIARQTSCLPKIVGIVSGYLAQQNQQLQSQTGGVDMEVVKTVIARAFLVLRTVFCCTVPADVLSQLYKMLRHCFCGAGAKGEDGRGGGTSALAGAIENEIIATLAVVAAKLRHVPVESAQRGSGDSAHQRSRVTPCMPTSFLDPLPPE